MSAQRKYPWDVWFASKFVLLKRGVDYHCSQSTMAQSIRNKASSLGLRLRMSDTGTEIMFAVVGRRRDEVPRTTATTISGEHETALAENGTD